MENHKTKDPIAIIGIGCRFPGGANDPKSFWNLLQKGVDAITEIPQDRWNLKIFYDRDPKSSGTACTRWGGFIDNIDQFDAHFFGISPREANYMDPQQRLLLETTWEALEDAGQVPELLSGSNTSVFIGICTSDYYDIQLAIGESDHIDAYTNTGGSFSIAANRISYLFNFRGPSMAVDTACSSSLVAVHLACQSLWSGESSLSLVGGVNLILTPGVTIGFSKASMLSPDGRSKAFDSEANGYVRGEGAGVVVLKPLSKAILDGDPIYATIRSTAINEDGRSEGMTAPNPSAQISMLKKAYRQARISPEKVQYVEAHGTGTQIGDRTEANSLGNVLSANRSSKNALMIGSVKTNIGHLESGSGIAGLIKAALALKHKKIPPSLHFKNPNPNIAFNKFHLRVPQTLEAWPDTVLPRVAGVNSFGFGGANAHVVLEEASETFPSLSVKDKYCLLPLSARSPESLRDLVQRYRTFITDKSGTFLQDMCYTASVRRSHHDHRIAIVFRSKRELNSQLEAYLSDENLPTMSTGRRMLGPQKKIAFVFSGMGPQWWGMGRHLLENEPVFRKKIVECDKLLLEHAGWSLLKELTADESCSKMSHAGIAQPANFSLQVALFDLWQFLGIKPDVVLGHSTGEVAAAYASGALTLDNAIQVISLRSKSQNLRSGTGKMMAVGLSLSEVRKLVDFDDNSVSVAAINSPKSLTLSGDTTTLENLAKTLEGKQVFYRFLQVDIPYHSRQMDPLKNQILKGLQDLQPKSTHIPIYSTVTGTLLSGEAFDANYWWKNVRDPVLFSATIEQLINDDYDLFLELGPHPVLTNSITECLLHKNRTGVVLSSLRRKENDEEMMLATLGKLYTLGHVQNWRRIYPKAGNFIQLPSYPWQRERYWRESKALKNSRLRENNHPFLGCALSSVYPCWQIELGKAHLFYLNDHRLQNVVVFPGAGYIEMALAAAKEIFDKENYALEDIEFKKALFLPNKNNAQVLQLIYQPKEAVFCIYSRSNNGNQSWTLHSTGIIRERKDETELSPIVIDKKIQTRCIEEISGKDCYIEFERKKLNYGPCFQGIDRLWRGSREAIGQIHIPEPLKKDIDDYLLHPAVLDSCIQVLVSILPSNKIGGNYLPVNVKRVRIFKSLAVQFWCHARLTFDNETIVEGDLTLVDKDGNVSALIEGFRLQSLRESQRPIREDLNNWLYHLQWIPQELVTQIREESLSRNQGIWIIFADRRGFGQKLSNLLTSRLGGRCVLVQPGISYEKIDDDNYKVNPSQLKDIESLLKSVKPNLYPNSGIIHLWNLDAPQDGHETSLSSLNQLQDPGCVCVLHLVQGMAKVNWGHSPHLWLVTSGLHQIDIDNNPVSVFQSPLWGLGRVIANEHPELNCRMVDVSKLATSQELELFCKEIFYAEFNSDKVVEDEVAIRGKKRYVPRLRHMNLQRAQQAEPNKVTWDDGVPFCLNTNTPGVLDELTIRETTRRKPEAYEVEIRVYATGLNFRDVMVATGMLSEEAMEGGYAGGAFGLECAGEIVSLGGNVKEFQIGDEVIALAPKSFSTFAITPADLVVSKPRSLNFEEAATIPMAFVTAYYALHFLARIQQGERVLIHAAAGGVGLAAVQIAQNVGAEVFATAGNPKKREYLQSLGVKLVMNSRSLNFADEIMEYTNDEGVDIVLNSLSGEAIPKSLTILRSYGRFIEIGKRDIYENNKLGLRVLGGNLSFSTVDIDRLGIERPGVIKSMLRELMSAFGSKKLSPLPYKVFPVSQVVSAYRYMAQAKHIGKIIISMMDKQITIYPSMNKSTTFRSDSTYLITGGVSGFGLEVAQWMVEQNARHLVLVGRRGISSNLAQKTIESMKKKGVQVHIAKEDVTQDKAITRILAHIDESMPQLGGIIHAAGIFDDGMLLNLDRERLINVMEPKVIGAWNLHTQTLECSLDFFVLFSSVTSLIGNPGQGNYVAANSFLDALAYYRQQLGMPALTINWGAISDVGYLSRNKNIGKHLEGIGVNGFDKNDAVEIFGRVLSQDSHAQLGAINMEWSRWRKLDLASARSPRFFEIISSFKEGPLKGDKSQKEQERQLLSKVLDYAIDERQEFLLSCMTEQIAKILGTSRSKLDINDSLTNQGLDSLMAGTLRIWVQKELETDLPMMDLLKGLSIQQLTVRIFEQLSSLHNKS